MFPPIDILSSLLLHSPTYSSHLPASQVCCMEVVWEFYLCREKSLRATSQLVCLPCGLPAQSGSPWLCCHSMERHLQFHSLLPH